MEQITDRDVFERVQEYQLLRSEFLQGKKISLHTKINFQSARQGRMRALAALKQRREAGLLRQRPAMVA